MSYKCEHCNTKFRHDPGDNCPQCGGKILEVQFVQSLEPPVPWWEDGNVWSGLMVILMFIGIVYFFAYNIYWENRERVVVIEATTCETVPCEIKVMKVGTTYDYTWVNLNEDRLGRYEVGDKVTVKWGELK